MATSLRSISTNSPKSIADNAHKVIQGMLAKLPADMLYWFCSKVLNLSPDVSRNTINFLKSQPATDGWRSASGLSERGMETSTDLTGSMTEQKELEQRLERLEATIKLLETSDNEPRLLEYRDESARSLQQSVVSSAGAHSQSSGDITKALSIIYERPRDDETDQPTALTSDRYSVTPNSTSIAQELGLRRSHPFLPS